ncbi:MAG: hypothetical protein ACTILK_06335 [Bifidobacterium crudilactis]|uniref:hypothetical protein n=1 Tax=Bifidobacterium crudilactis TaxID=327277 RepID=UPI003F9B9D74
MPIQDDARENQMIDRFNLIVPPGRSRGDIDAHLQIDNIDIPFELKSTTKGSIATARDFGMGHIDKWRRKRIHWLFGFYLTDERHADYFIYCSPDAMESWYSQMQQYIRPDILIGERLPQQVGKDMVVELLGEKEIYSLADAMSIMKKQWTVAQYRQQQDKTCGYSLSRMIEILQYRAQYVIARGSTLNNPHIPQSYFAGMTHITDDPSITLRNMVRAYLKNKSAIEEAAA